MGIRLIPPQDADTGIVAGWSRSAEGARRWCSVAAATGLADHLLRVAPNNGPAIALYRAAGFSEVEPNRAAEWYQGQPVAYRWFERPRSASGG